MLPVVHRLTKDQDIKRLFEKGRKARSANFGVRYGKNAQGQTRFAVIVGSKTSKRAVRRNAVRRKIRAILHAHLKDIVPGHDVAIVVYAGALEKTSAELQIEILNVLKKAGLL